MEYIVDASRAVNDFPMLCLALISQHIHYINKYEDATVVISKDSNITRITNTHYLEKLAVQIIIFSQFLVSEHFVIFNLGRINLKCIQSVCIQ